MCEVCAIESGRTKTMTYDKIITSHKGCNNFMVFQGKRYFEELKNGYICAPYKDAGGNSPSHWTLLENVKPGDIIFHGLAKISAISIATSACFSSKIIDGITEVSQVNCLPTIIEKTIVTSEYLDDIVETCSQQKYQPFDKNGNGRQGYLFDLNDKLAGIFARALVEKNPNVINKVPELKDILKY